MYKISDDVIVSDNTMTAISPIQEYPITTVNSNTELYTHIRERMLLYMFDIATDFRDSVSEDNIENLQLRLKFDVTYKSRTRTIAVNFEVSKALDSFSNRRQLHILNESTEDLKTLIKNLQSEIDNGP